MIPGIYLSFYLMEYNVITYHSLTKEEKKGIDRYLNKKAYILLTQAYMNMQKSTALIINKNE